MPSLRPIFAAGRRLPLRILFTRCCGSVVFLRRRDQWYAWKRGALIPVSGVSLEAIEYFRHFVPPKGGVVFDVGGELGRETLQFSRIVGPGGKVFVFECAPAHLDRLRKIADSAKNVEVVDVACWAETTVLEFFHGHTPGSGTVLPQARGQRGQELADTASVPLSVRAERLDSLWCQLCEGRPVDFLKMDIEGAGLEALWGAREMLRHTRRVVVAAYHQRDGAATASEVAKILAEAGFSVRVDENLHVYAQRTAR